MPTAKIVIEDEVNVRIKGLDPEAIAKAQEALTFWVPGYMHMPAFKLRRWDGKIKLFKASGSTYLNLVDSIVEPLDSLGYDLEIVEDRRITHDSLVDQIDFINDLVVAEYEKDGKPIILWEHQVDGINTAIEHGCGILELATGSGKAQPLTSLISTPNGWKTMGSVQIGDEISTWCGNTTIVTGIFPQGKKKLFEVEFQDGRTVQCCDEHLWYIYDKRLKRSKGKDELERFDVLPTKTIKRIFDTANGGGSRQLQIPLTPIEYTEQNLPIHPYVLGVLLGDGSFRSDITITTADTEIVDILNKLLPENDVIKTKSKYGYRIHASKPYGKKDTLREALSEMGLRELYSHEKFIPYQYLFCSIEQRYEILQGLMDTDGYVAKKTGSMSYSTSSLRLADDVIQLVQSLGGIAYKTSKIPFYRNSLGEKINGKESYSVHIQLPDPTKAVKIERKKMNARKTQYSDGLTLRIVGVRESEKEVDMQCISVKHPSRVYITDNYIVTHNTLICGVLSKIYSKIGNVVVVVPNIDLVIQTQHWFKQIGIDTGIWYGDVKDRKPVTIATWQSLDHFPELFANVMTVIVDECFTGDTPILTEHGWKPISEINVGEMVVTYNDNNSFELNQVEKLHENITSSEEKLYEMVFDDGTVLKVTGNHKILTERGWIRADELLYSDEVISINKDTLSKSESIYDFIEKDKNNKQTII